MIYNLPVHFIIQFPNTILVSITTLASAAKWSTSSSWQTPLYEDRSNRRQSCETVTICIVKLEMPTLSQNYNPTEINPLYCIRIIPASFGALHFETVVNYPVFSSKVKNLFFKWLRKKMFKQ